MEELEQTAQGEDWFFSNFPQYMEKLSKTKLGQKVSEFGYLERLN